MVINIILFIILILLLIYVVNYKRNITKINYDNIENNKLLEKEKEELIKETSKTRTELDIISQEVKKCMDTQMRELDKLANIQKQVEETQKSAREVARNAFESYHETLQKAYEDAEIEYDSCKEYLINAYDNLQYECQTELDKTKAELEKIQATRRAALEAAIREEEIKEKLDFYCLTPRTMDINDIKTLERIKPQLNNPRILSMLIWSTYFQKDMTALCNKILGLKTVTGIYKITNQENDKCYIGQSVDVAKRWKDHAKCGLGIDAPQGNKLYKEMQEIGIWNFSWELLEECPREQLNEKEKFYIELYQSKDYGYNTTKGNS